MSSSDIAVSVRGLSKEYQIAQNATLTTTAQEALFETLKNPFGRVQTETFHALKDVSFDIQQGDVVGIIGRNGAGKSTLFKILSRITEPTAGKISLYGRVGSLLEVGTGFHPELTGRENIFLNGAILGMSRREITKQFDAIVDFADIGQFLETPVKRYSSGMYVRLAFAVAAHLSSEILIMDEVLAVGDANFQKKCLGKMHDVAEQEGRTIMFVSHSMASVIQLCSKAIFLNRGVVNAYGPVTDVVNEYMEFGLDQSAEAVWSAGDAPGDETAQILAVRVLNSQDEVSTDHYISQPITLEIEYRCHQDGIKLNPSFHVMNMHGTCIFATSNIHDAVWGPRVYSEGIYRARCVIPEHFLNDGQYRVSVFLSRDVSHIAAFSIEVITFNILDDASSRGEFTGTWIGTVRPMIPWTTFPSSSGPSSSSPSSPGPSLASSVTSDRQDYLR